MTQFLVHWQLKDEIYVLFVIRIGLGTEITINTVETVEIAAVKLPVLITSVYIFISSFHRVIPVRILQTIVHPLLILIIK